MFKSAIIIHRLDEKSERLAGDAQEAFRGVMGLKVNIYPVNEHLKEEDENAELVFAIGGDGTVLTAMSLQGSVIAVNTGTVGFLANHSAGNYSDTVGLIYQLVEKLSRGEFTKTHHFPLLVSANDHGLGFLAYNDLVIQRDIDKPMLELTIFVDGQTIGPIRTDGLIVASQIGATGYSLSAGGPVLAPGQDCMVLTPICPRATGARSIVIPSSAGRVTITSKTETRFLTDGGVSGVGDQWEVQVAKQYCVPLLHTSLSKPYMDSLRDKLGWSL